MTIGRGPIRPIGQSNIIHGYRAWTIRVATPISKRSHTGGGVMIEASGRNSRRLAWKVAENV